MILKFAFCYFTVGLLLIDFQNTFKNQNQLKWKTKVEGRLQFKFDLNLFQLEMHLIIISTGCEYFIKLLY